MKCADKMPSMIRRFISDQAWREERVAAYASVGILVFLTSFFWSPTRDFMHVVYGLAFFAPVFLVLLLRKPDFNQYGGWFTGLAMIYCVYAAASTLWSPAPRLDFFAQHLLFLAVWLIGTAWLAARGQLGIDRIYAILAATGAVAAAIYQALFHWHSYPLGYLTELETRLGAFGWSVIRNPNTIGFVFGSTSLIAYMRWLAGGGRWQGFGKFLLFAVNGSAAVASQSRGAVTGLAVCLVLAFALNRSRPRKWIPNALMAMFVIGAMVALFWSGKLLNRWDMASLASSARPEIWSHLIETTREEHLLFGEGLVKTSRIYVPGLASTSPFNHAHNSFVDAFYRTGLVGLVLMCGHIVYVFAHWSRSPLLLPLFLWLLLGCMTSLFDHPGFFWQLEATWWNYWIPAGLIGAVITSERLKTYRR
jgi:hypothetical protein